MIRGKAMDVVLIPAYEPEEVLIPLTAELKENGFTVLVVNDGSGDAYQHVFDAVSEYATVTALAQNSGKGAALKAGMRYIKENMPDCENFITCDADGQHLVSDVIRVRDKLHAGEKFVLTTRRRRRGIPLRSRIGNNLSRVVYTLLSNRWLSDNQSGLRGFCSSNIDWLINVEKNNYDYEMNVLYYAAKKGMRIATLPIEAIYIGNNESSHFNPIADTLKIYKSLFSLAMGKFISFFTCQTMILFISVLYGYRSLFYTIPSVGFFAFGIEYFMSRIVFFRGTKCNDHWTSLVYTIICYFMYTLGCTFSMFVTPWVPLYFAFNITFIVCLPLRYYLHKAMAFASQTVE